MAYISIEEADEYINLHSVDRDLWQNASEDLKTVVLEEASDHIDLLRFRGRKIDITQSREFPRYLDEILIDSELFFQGTPIDQTKVPEEVKAACCLEAIEILRELNHADIKERRLLQEQNVKDVSYGTTRESYGGAKRPLLSLAAYRKLDRWIAKTLESI